MWNRNAMRGLSAGLVVVISTFFAGHDAQGADSTSILAASSPTPPQGTRQTPGASQPAGDTSYRGKSSHGGSDWEIPAIIGGALAIGAIAALLTSEKNANANSARPSNDEVSQSLLSDGPQVAPQFNMSAFAVRGFVQGGWPIVVDFQQDSPGITRLKISARDIPEIYTYELNKMCPLLKRCLVKLALPREVFGSELMPAVFATFATDEEGAHTIAGFHLYALGAGPRAVGSSAIDRVTFGPGSIHVAEGQSALYRFYSHSDFSNSSVEFWKVDNSGDGRRLYFVDDIRIDGGLRRNQWIGKNDDRQWNGMGKQHHVSVGSHQLGVRAWDVVGDWMTVWSDSTVLVKK